MFESSLLPTISSHITTFGKNLLPTFELASGFGIADVVFYSLDPQIVNSRLKQKLDPIESYDLIRILTSLNDTKSRTISLTMLTSAFPSLRRNKGKIISFLIDNEFLIPNKNISEFRKGRRYKIGLKEVIAIEAKLSNWQRGLYQAYRYRQYATKSYLALYTKYIHRALDHREDFLRANVGLIEVGDDFINVHLDPDREHLKMNTYSALVYERLLGAKNFSPRS